MGPRIDRPALLKSAVIFTLLMAFFVTVLGNRARDARALRQTRLTLLATQIGRSLEQRLSSRIGVLEFFGRALPALHIRDYDDFAAWTRPIREGIPGFFGINFIDPEGVIVWVEPYEENKAAVGRRLSDRPDIWPYLEKSRAEGQPQLTHFVELFQGPAGFVVYVPVLEGGTFRGFLNGVFVLDEFLPHIMPETAIPYAISLVPRGHPETLRYVGGGEPVGDSAGRYTASLYGLEIDIEVKESSRVGIAHQVDTATTVVFAAALLLTCGITGMTYMLLRSRGRLRDRLETERFQGTLLNLLVHDILSPLLVIRYSVDAARRTAEPTVVTQLDKTYAALDQLHAVITRVRDLRAVHRGKLGPALVEVPINDVIAEALAAFEARFKDKGIVPDFRPAEGNPSILVDRVIFQANVMNNVLANAVKFSEAGSHVTVVAKARKDQVVLEIEDQGMGMSPEMLKSVLDEEVDLTKPGTRGEAGTGIGMLQIKSYTRYFGGRVVIHSRHKTAYPDTHGTTVCLYLRRAGEILP